jgi:hypothetical protein
VITFDSTYGSGQVEHGFPSDVRLFMVIFNLDVDDVHWSAIIATSCQQVYVEARQLWLVSKPNRSEHTFAHSVEASLFAGDDDVSDVFALVPPLRSKFNTPIAVQHVQNAVCIVSVNALDVA